MKNKVLIFLITIALSYNVSGQIAKEIESYVDSTEIIVHNGRRMLLNELNDSNVFRIKDIYDYLTSLTSDKHYSAFYYTEDLYINMLTDNWFAVEKLMIDYENYMSKTIYPGSEDLIYKLYEITVEWNEQLLSNCYRSGVSDQTKRLVEILYQYMKTGGDEDYNRMLSSYKKEFTNYQYESFEKNFLPGKKVKAAINFSFGSGMVLTTGDLADNFNGNVSFIMGMDVNIQKVFTSLYLHGSSLKLQVPFMAISDFDTLNFTKGEKFTYLDAGLKAGYFVVRSDRFHVAPYLSVSGGFLESSRYDDSEDNDREYEVFNSFTYGAGIHTEVKIKDFENMNSYYYGTSQGYFSIKLEAGYNKILKFKNNFAIGDTPYVNVALVLGLGTF